jgi:hypothetical protein
MRSMDTVTKEDHIKNICMLANILTEKHYNILLNRRFRIGSAQKGLNLYLKYL